MSQPISLQGIIRQILSMENAIDRLVVQVESLEHFSNQQNILVDTLGDIMEELKKSEH